MSDDDFMMEDVEEEDYNFDYEDDEGEEQDVDAENSYYNAKALKGDDPVAAKEEFLSVIAAQNGEKGDWGFKACKQLVKLSLGTGAMDECLDWYRELLTYTKSAVTRNYGEKSINNILDYASNYIASNTSSDKEAMAFMEKFYNISLTALEEAKNDRLWLKTNLKLAKLYLDRKEYARLTSIINALHIACQQDEEKGDEQWKGTYLLEVYAIEIQMYTQTKNITKLKDLYTKTLGIKSAIPHPRIMGVIRECGGKMHMNEANWKEAFADFFESFRNYDEAGSLDRINVLKYLVLASMLSEEEINPFDSQEIKPYKNDAQIIVMTDLVDAYQQQEVTRFERILKDHHAEIMGDEFIRQYIDKVLVIMRTTVLLNLVKPYRRIKIDFIASELQVSSEYVFHLLISLTMDKRLAGKIDQTEGLFEVDRSAPSDLERNNAMALWTEKVGNLASSLLAIRQQG